MRIRFSTVLTCTTVLALSLTGCGGGSSSSSSAANGSLQVSLTDSPIDDANKVVIHFTSALIHKGAGEDTEVTVIDPLTDLPGRSINLMALEGDNSVVLFDQTLENGTYSWIRLDLDLDASKTYIELDDGSQHALDCTSCENSGFKLNSSFAVDSNVTRAYTLDFDLRKSITLAGSRYKLRPTLRVTATNETGHLNGHVDSTLINSLGGEEGCAVYVYDGQIETPMDLFIPENGQPPASHINPIATANVDTDTQEYTVGFLTEGEYTVALTCDAENDDALVQDNGLIFHGTQNIGITAGQTTTHLFVP